VSLKARIARYLEGCGYTPDLRLGKIRSRLLRRSRRHLLLVSRNANNLSRIVKSSCAEEHL
jgi:hypothetical protein